MGGTEEQSGVAQLRAACWEVVGKGGLAPVFPSRPGTLLMGFGLAADHHWALGPGNPDGLVKVVMYGFLVCRAEFVFTPTLLVYSVICICITSQFSC